MSHLVESMAFTNATPWHGIGQTLHPHQPLEVWASAAGLDWRIESTDVMYAAQIAQGQLFKTNPASKVLYRSDNLEPLSVVSPRYKVVQPREVLEFYRDLVSAGGFELETAGVLKGGRKLWALARTGQETQIKGNDRVKAYLLLATSCDGTLCTTAQFTSVRVVCNNTLQMAIRDRNGSVKVPHSTVFDPQVVKEELGIGLSGWDSFIGNIKQLSQRSVSTEEARLFFQDVLDEPESQAVDDPLTSKAMQQVTALYCGAGIGSMLSGSRGTAWGMLNAMTEYVDHHRRARSQDYRLDSAWFGQGARLKQAALDRALTLLE